MKCDELRIENACVYGPDAKVYLAEQVDAAIAELKQTMQDKLLEAMKYKAENIELLAWKRLHENCDNYIDTLEKKLEDAKASHYAEMVDAGMRERRLRRTLWIARAERARDKAFEYHFKNNVEMCAKWDNVHLMLMAKAEEYK